MTEHFVVSPSIAVRHETSISQSIYFFVTHKLSYFGGYFRQIGTTWILLPAWSSWNTAGGHDNSSPVWQMKLSNGGREDGVTLKRIATILELIRGPLMQQYDVASCWPWQCIYTHPNTLHAALIGALWRLRWLAGWLARQRRPTWVTDMQTDVSGRSSRRARLTLTHYTDI